MMSNRTSNKLLEYIPRDRLTADQVGSWQYGEVWRTFKLLREISDMNEISLRDMLDEADVSDDYVEDEFFGDPTDFVDDEDLGAAIWCDNGTMTYINKFPSDNYQKSGPSLVFHDDVTEGIECTITGENDDAIAETAAFFWRLKWPERWMQIDNSNSKFNFRAVRPEQFIQMFDSHPNRHIHFRYVCMSVDQAIALAARHYPIHLTIEEKVAFEDEGTAFVDALQNRQSSFGCLYLYTDSPDRGEKCCLDSRNLQRLFQTQYIDKVVVEGCLSDDLLTLLLLSPAKEKSWNNYHHLTRQKLQIDQSKLTLEVYFENEFHGGTIFSKLPHFDQLNFTQLRVDLYCYKLRTIPEDLIVQILDFIAARTNLERLEWGIRLCSGSLKRNLFSVVGEHKGLRTFATNEYECFALHHDETDHAYDLIKSLLKQNRNIEVSFIHDNRILTDKCFVDMLYGLNRFYRGSGNLGKEPLEIQSSLMGTALSESASIDFQRSGLLLAHNTDILCELIDGVLVHEIHIEDQDTSKLLELITEDELEPEQVAHWSDGHTTPTYKLCREPVMLNELKLYGSCMAIWMDNETLVYISEDEDCPLYPKRECIDRFFCFTCLLGDSGRIVRLAVTGESDDAIAESASFWWSLHCPEEHFPLLTIDNEGNNFDFSVVTAKHLSMMFLKNEKRRVIFKHLEMTPYQSVALATRPHPIDVTFDQLTSLTHFAFVGALQDRKSCFGSLSFSDSTSYCYSSNPYI